MFADFAKITIQAGNGGNGHMSFRRERFVARGGPDGGDGGNGGDIVFIASNNQDTLADFRHNKLLKAENGQSGGKRKKHGKNGESLEIKVPVGTVVANQAGEILVDLAESGQTATIAHGGKGGFGNAHFTSSTRQAPKFAEKGEPGEKLDVSLELKLIANVGLIGLPNAGKSTLLSVISNARPEIANYPFTTLIPNLGVVDMGGKTSLLFADIPGLIEGAHQGKGLGVDFLRHTERTNVLVHLIDVYGKDISADYKTIMAELAAYKTDLSKRPQIVALSKIDGFAKTDLAKKIQQLKKVVPRGTSVLAISSLNNEGIKELLSALSKQVEKAKAKAAQNPELPVITLQEDPLSWKVTKSADRYIIKGRKVERFASKTYFGEESSEQRLRDILRKMGITRELEKQGINSGDAIQIGEPAIGQLEY